MHAEMTSFKPHRLIASDRVEGTRVFNADGRKIGTVKRLMIDKISGNVAYAVLSFGGILGMGEAYRSLPWASMKYNPELEAYELVTLMSEEDLEKAPYATKDDVDWGYRERPYENYWMGF